VKLAGPKAALSASEQGGVNNFSTVPPMDSYEMSSAFGAFRHNASRINIMPGEAWPQAGINAILIHSLAKFNMYIPA
jgi:hypothetical protein